MTISQYDVALAEARFCLAALADGATNPDDAAHFEQLLIDLDAAHNDDCLALTEVVAPSEELLDVLVRSIEQMQRLGGDRLRLEILLARAG